MLLRFSQHMLWCTIVSCGVSILAYRKEVLADQGRGRVHVLPARVQAHTASVGHTRAPGPRLLWLRRLRLRRRGLLGVWVWRQVVGDLNGLHGRGCRVLASVLAVVPGRKTARGRIGQHREGVESGMLVVVGCRRSM